jgi:hypothetical protein
MQLLALEAKLLSLNDNAGCAGNIVPTPTIACDADLHVEGALSATT